MAAAPVPPVLPRCPDCGGAGMVFPLGAPPSQGAIVPSTLCAKCKGTGLFRLPVVLRVGHPGVSYWNILWSDIRGGIPKARMRDGSFPKHHPVIALGGAEVMDRFRALGYWASCFPDGDGMTFRPEPNGKTPEEVTADIEAVFGWEVRQ